MVQNISINGRKIGPSFPPFIIAEMSANHNGSLDRALKTIEVAANCGADAIKIQTYTADTMTIKSDKPEFKIHGGLWDGYKLYDLYKWAQTPYEWHQAMFNHARELGITIFSTPFDESAVDLLESLNAPAYKIASFELVDLPLINYLAQKKKPLIMSTGMATQEEIEEAVETAQNAGCKEIILLHCISSYPAPSKDSNLKQMPVLGETFNTLIGLSDHTMGTAVSVASVALGACVIEKHFTLNRNDKGPDCEFSIEPQELKTLVLDSKNAWLSLGKKGFERHTTEDQSKTHRRSIYFVNSLKAGEKITKNDIKRIRPAKGLKPKYFDDLIGKTLIVDVKAGDATNWEVIK